jgi:predicted  nucleic acid-binding Zn-ribbon protein
MPHQCLKCGKVFEEGSSQLLKGCPDCNGNRFFFTKEPLDETKRMQITEKIGEDIKTRLIDHISSESENLSDKSGYWIRIKAKDLRKVVEKQLNNTKSNVDCKEKIDIINDDGYREAKIKRISSEVDHSDSPETIGVDGLGIYNIDIKGLLEQEPIIIEKDGSYTIHLPSIFKMIDKKNK